MKQIIDLLNELDETKDSNHYLKFYGDFSGMLYDCHDHIIFSFSGKSDLIKNLENYIDS